MALVRVLYDFEGRDPGELSVLEGEVVRIISKQSGSSQWVLVETTASSPVCKGYVPIGYLGDELNQQEKDIYLSSPTPNAINDKINLSKNNQGNGNGNNVGMRRMEDEESGMMGNNGKQSGSAGRFYTPQSKQKLNATNTVTPGKMLTPFPLMKSNFNSSKSLHKSYSSPVNVDTLARSNQNMSEEALQRILRKNDDWLAQVLDAKNRRNSALESGLNKVKSSLAAARDKSQDLLKQIEQFEGELFNKERKWSRMLNNAA